MTSRFPDSPASISLSRLKELDADAPMNYYASAKLDGRRRTCYFDGKKWTYRAKNKGDAQPIAPEAVRALEALNWPAGLMLDAEITGLRKVGDANCIYIFDVLMIDDEWLQWPFHRRVKLIETWRDLSRGWPSTPLVRFAEHVANPDMVDLFERQITEPLSEGIVVRRSDQINIGDWNRSVTSPSIFKVKFARIKENQ